MPIICVRQMVFLKMIFLNKYRYLRSIVIWHFYEKPKLQIYLDKDLNDLIKLAEFNNWSNAKRDRMAFDITSHYKYLLEVRSPYFKTISNIPIYSIRQKRHHLMKVGIIVAKKSKS